MAPAALLEVLAEALIALGQGRAEAPTRIAVRVPEGGLLAAMPGFDGVVLGAKLVTVFPANPGRGLPGHQALIALFDAATGAPLAVLDGTAITAARTGAVSALATRALARPEARVLAILGTGVQARSHWEAVRLVRDFAEVRIAGRTPDQVERLATEWGAVPYASFEAAARGAEVICCCTHAEQPILRREWLAPGAHVTSVGIGGCELDPAVIAAADVLAVEAPVAFAPFPGGAYELQGVDPGRGVALGHLLDGSARGRENPTQLTVFKSVGHAVEDVAVAAWVYGQDRMLR